MLYPSYLLPSVVRHFLACSAVLLGVGVALAQTPSQTPLLSRDGGGVSPNVVLDLDDSGSMLYQHMPEGSFKLVGKDILLAGDESLWMHPSDTRKYSGTDRGAWPANIGATGAQLTYQQQVRSPDVNTLYYNPETTYLPWINTNGTRFAAATPAAAPTINEPSTIDAGIAFTAVDSRRRQLMRGS